jgi:aminoglycoside phosphotransferase (APT) family kinase protein
VKVLDAGTGLLRAAPRLWRAPADRHRLNRVLVLVPRALDVVAAQTGTRDPTDWVVHSAIVSGTRMAVVKLGPLGGETLAVLKAPAGAAATASRRREVAALAGLTADPRVADFAGLLPESLAAGSADGQMFTVERALPGVEAHRLVRPAEEDGRALGEAASVIGGLHRRTGCSVVIDGPILDRWIDDRVALATAATRNAAALERLRQRLRDAWMGRTEVVCWVHGDFWTGNVLTDPASGRVTGIVDWEWAGDRELPAHDVVYSCLHHRMQAGRGEFGDIVRALLDGAGWDPSEQEVLRAAGILPERRQRIEDELLLLVWLRHIAYNLIQDAGIARNIVWVRHNVDNVLRAL